MATLNSRQASLCIVAAVQWKGEINSWAGVFGGLGGCGLWTAQWVVRRGVAQYLGRPTSGLLQYSQWWKQKILTNKIK